jgi:hypothetical protein
MANEFKHKDPGAELTQAEFIAACGDGHIFACQATGDILYASSATVLKNLGKQAAGTILNMGGSCIPAWTATPTIGSTSWCNAGHAHAASNSGGTVCANVLAGTTLKSCVVSSSLTSVGTLTALTVDDVAINGKVVTMTGSACDTIVMTAAANGAFSLVTTDAVGAAANIVITADGTVAVNSAGLLTLNSGAAINIEPESCSAILLDGTISIDAGVVTGATSITSTNFVTGNSGTAKFLDGDGSHYFTLAAHATTTASVGYTWPAADGSCGQALTTNSSGVLSWATAGGGLDSCANAIIANGYGVVIGGAQIAQADSPGNVQAELQLIGTAAADTTMAILRHSADACDAQINFGKSRHATIGCHTIVADDDYVGSINWFGDDGGDLYPYVASIRARVDGTPGLNDMPGALEFYTTPDGAQGRILAMTIDSIGAITTPLQPAFLVGLHDTSDTDVTGDNSAYTFGAGNAVTEVFDQNADFATDTFTAPVTGRYFFFGTINLRGVLSTHTDIVFRFNSSNRIYRGQQFDIGEVITPSGEINVLAMAVADMDAADTITMIITVANGSKVIDVVNSDQLSKFGGYKFA